MNQNWAERQSRMQTRRGKQPPISASEPALRVIMRRLRDIMAEDCNGQAKLDKIVHLIAGVMVAEVCSIYLRRQDNSLELFATEGLNADAVHNTRLKRAEGLVGRCAELNQPINEQNAKSHPAFSYHPETGEEAYQSLLAVPIQKSGQVLGVLVIQNHTEKEYSQEDIEVLQSTAMIVAELFVSGGVAGAQADIEISRSLALVVQGQPISSGIALGHAVIHEPRVAVSKLLSDDLRTDLSRLDNAIAQLRDWIDETLKHEGLSSDGEHRDVLEAYRMFAYDQGWARRMREAVEDGLTAEAAVERVQNASRTQMLKQSDPYWRERAHDLDDLADRLLRILSGRSATKSDGNDFPSDAILIARTMGPAELLDYDSKKLRGLIVEDGSTQSHVAIVAKALEIPAIGQARRIVEQVSIGDAVIVDAQTGEVHLRPSPDVVNAYSDKVRFQARRQEQYRALCGKPAVTADGIEISLNVNAGLEMDMPHVHQSGADGVGLFRTELLFMLAKTFPRAKRQEEAYRKILALAEGKPVIFRALDIGGDKNLPYLKFDPEENPAMGWRAIRLSLDRQGLLRTQIRALLRASEGKQLSMMIPMISTASEMKQVRELIDLELHLMRKRAEPEPSSIKLGAMFEVPSLLFELDALLPLVDFISIGSNDLLQFLYAVDRTNGRVATRYDALSTAPLRFIKQLIHGAANHKVPVTVCGEMAGRPIEAMALVGLGIRSLSMAPAAIGPVKSMILSLDKADFETYLNKLLDQPAHVLREELTSYAKKWGIEI